MQETSVVWFLGGEVPGRRDKPPTLVFLNVPGGSDGQESACNVGDLGLPNPWGWEDPLKEGMATHSSILAWRIPVDKGAWQATVLGVTKSQHDWETKHSNE